jgi:hypothetical protein
MDWVACAVLVPIIAAYVFYAARLLHIGLGEVWERTDRALQAGLDLGYVLTNDSGDCDYGLLWVTQLPVLKALRSAGRAGVPTARMAQLYRDLARVYPELFDGSNFSDWVHAFQNAKAAVPCQTGDVITITERGLLILEQLEEAHIVN